MLRIDSSRSVAILTPAAPAAASGSVIAAVMPLPTCVIVSPSWATAEFVADKPALDWSTVLMIILRIWSVVAITCLLALSAHYDQCELTANHQ
jgi:beta-lactamase regulating signal transducer with metallopeptidase domain